VRSIERVREFPLLRKFHLFGMAGSIVLLACVGVFPMNNLPPHIAAAMTFFRTGLVTVLLFGIAIQRQRADRRAVDRRANIAGIATVLAYASFLVVLQLQPGGASGFHAGLDAARPFVWPTAILEWSILLAMIIWFFVVAACRSSPKPRNT
jgi:hypothetical protein